MSADQFEYWKHTQLTLDVSPGRGSSFSIEIPLGRSVLYSIKTFYRGRIGKLTAIAGDKLLAIYQLAV